MNNRNTLLFSVFILSVSALLFLRSAKEPPHVPGKSQELPPSRNCIVDLPPFFDFAGEPVPLSDEEVYERLDREIHVNTYYHSSTIQILKLSSRWFPLIDSILNQNGIPADFKYLAAAESGLRNVVSPAGARGIWQIMPRTAREYGLTVNSEVDERYHIEKSTEAACRYLKDAYEKLGSWTLAAASYNMGMEGIQNVMEEQKESNYYDLYLNTETSRYLFRILALKAILNNPGHFGFCFDENDLYKPLKATTLTIDTPVNSLVDLAHSQDISYKTLKFYNPWLRAKSLKSAGQQAFEIKIPA